MNMADAAEQVLRRSDRDLSSREIADQAAADGLIAPRSDKPWVYIAAAIRKDNRRRQNRGEAVRFASAGTGRYRLKK
jgi:HB1, ASXL, restriction endonuclease HTH domain